MTARPLQALRTVPRDIWNAAYPGPCRRARVEPCPAGRFYLVHNGLPALILPLYSAGPGSAVLDLVAVTPEGLAHTMREPHPFLGHHLFDEADILRTRLRLFRDPVAWLAERGDGVAVVDWFLAAPLLIRLRGITCDDGDHADALRNRLLRYGRVPPLYVASGSSGKVGHLNRRAAA